MNFSIPCGLWHSVIRKHFNFFVTCLVTGLLSSLSMICLPRNLCPGMSIGKCNVKNLNKDIKRNLYLDDINFSI